MVFERQAREYDVYHEIYIEKEQIAVAKNDQDKQEISRTCSLG
jgi:hypothetical protein